MPETKKYGIIYADPPWRYDMKRGHGVAENHYPTMSIEEICALPVADLAAKDSALFLWGTFPQLKEAFRVIDAWGFQYKTLAKTAKRTPGFTAWGSGHALTRKCAFWLPAAIRNGRAPESISLSFPISSSTAKSRILYGKKSLS